MTTCPESKTNLVMHFTINLAFVNYFYDNCSKFDNGLLSLGMNMHEQVLPVYLTDFSLSSPYLKSSYTRISVFRRLIY